MNHQKPIIASSFTVAQKIHRALILVGSPRLKKSTSFSLSNYLGKQLQQQGVETEIQHLYTALTSSERWELLKQSLQKADLVILAFPLYIDSLPAPVISALEKIANEIPHQKSITHFAAIVNCGFPEAYHNNIAIAQCAEFARTVGFAWMGALSLGGGEGIVHAVPLKELDGRVTAIKRSLELVAQELAESKAISEEAKKLMAKPIIPSWMYHLVGSYSWKTEAKKFGT